MMKYKKLLQEHQRGFTIVEVMVVVIVIGILATVAYGGYNGATGRGYDTAIISDAEALDSVVTNLGVRGNGFVSFGDDDANGVDDGYHYDDTLINNSTMIATNAELNFQPTKGNYIDAKVTTDGTEYCIAVYNPRSSQWKTAATAYQLLSNKNVTYTYNAATPCTHS